MILINIAIIQAPQRLVGPIESDTGGGESSPGDPSGQSLSASTCSTPASSWAVGAAPAQPRASGSSLGMWGRGWALLSRARLQGAGDKPCSGATGMGMMAPGGLEQCPGPWAGWCMYRTAHRREKARTSPSRLHSISNSFQKLQSKIAVSPRVCIV